VSETIVLLSLTDQSVDAVINPRTKFKWIEEHWSPSELADAERWMEEAVSIFIRPEAISLTNDVLFVGTDACPLSS
jgi:hypothetical protein